MREHSVVENVPPTSQSEPASSSPAPLAIRSPYKFGCNSPTKRSNHNSDTSNVPNFTSKKAPWPPNRAKHVERQKPHARLKDVMKTTQTNNSPTSTRRRPPAKPRPGHQRCCVSQQMVPTNGKEMLTTWHGKRSSSFGRCTRTPAK